MLFNSLTFVVFFAVVVTAYWSIRSWNARKNLLVVASYIFYGAWNPPFAALLFSTTAMDFWLGRQMAKAEGRRSRRAWLVGSVCMNLSMLGFFKYGNFLLQNFQWLLARIGIIYQPPHLDILLPVGISFYTFHSLSYTLDIYRGVLKPTSRCAISSWPFPFFLSWSPGRLSVRAIFFRNLLGRQVCARASFSGDCCS
jgi:Predicted membrane protein involved in D-alanine export